jgi:predicted permease
VHFRLVLRGLARSPLFSVAAILSLALGIGANTAIFSLIDQLLLRTLPVPHPEELVYLYSSGPWEGVMSSDEPDGPSFSYPLFRELQKTQTPFTGIAGARAQLASISSGDRTTYDIVRLVSGNYFELLGVKPALGRLFSEDDDRIPGAHPVAILSHAYWTSRFAASSTALNRPLIINGLTFTIIGVAPQGFLGERSGEPPDLYIPLSMKKAITPDWDAFENRQNAWVTLAARRKPGVTRERAENDVNAVYRAQVEKDILLLRQPGADLLRRFRARRITLKPGEYGRGGPRDRLRAPLLLLIAIASLVLAIACANVANLQLARATARTKEIAVRLAVGASRVQLIRQLLAESFVLALAGGALGILFAYGTLRVVIASLPLFSGVDGVFTPSLDPRVLLFSLVLSGLTGIAFGLFPALHASRPDLVAAIKEQTGQVSPGGSANFLRKGLVTAQVAIAVALLISGGLFAKSLVNLTRLDLGMQMDHLVVFNILPKFNRYTDAGVADLYARIAGRFAALPGVTSVSASQLAAVAGNRSGGPVTVEGYLPGDSESAADLRANVNMVGANYFRTMKTPLIAGREFTPGDDLAKPRVAIVNEAFAKRFFGNSSPLGRHMSEQRPPAEKLDIEIIGVAKNAAYADMRQPVPPVYYLPIQQNRTWFQIYFYIRTTTPPDSFLPLIPREVAALDPNLPVRFLKTMDTHIQENLFQERMLSALAGAFAALATLMAALGLYGVLAYNIARRTREIGVRIALGAVPRDVRALVVREVALVLLIGTAAGAAAAAAGGKLVQALLYGLQPWDPSIYGIAVAALWLVALAAAYFPARRAASVDPMIALRHE